ncbi:MAG: peptidylprolyl isomerase [Acidobacteriota bacterium]
MLVAAVALPAAAQDKKLSVVMRATAPFYDVNGPIEVVLRLRNDTGAPFSTAPGMLLDDGIVVKDHAGNALAKSGIIEKEGAKLPDTIPQGQEYIRTINLRLGYPQGLAAPGCFTASWENPKISCVPADVRIAPKYDKAKRYSVAMETSMGAFEIELSPDKAPNHVSNFVSLSASGFYDGLTFHRVVDGFMIQGGDPKGDGTGTAGYKLRAEPNDLKHEKGAVVMARGDDPNSASCQFYICLAPQPKLDGAYTVFGHVVKGMDVVEKIGKVKTGAEDRPVEKVTITKVTVSEKPAS